MVNIFIKISLTNIYHKTSQPFVCSKKIDYGGNNIGEREGFYIGIMKREGRWKIRPRTLLLTMLVGSLQNSLHIKCCTLKKLKSIVGGRFLLPKAQQFQFSLFLCLVLYTASLLCHSKWK